jgi:uncharacterized protein (TIGR03437 family)
MTSPSGHCRKSWLFVRRWLFLAALAASAGTSSTAQPVVQGVLNAASYSGTLAPGAWAAIFGQRLAPTTVTAQAIPLPYTLGQVSVTVGGLAAPLGFVSAGQINIVIPFETPRGAEVPVVVTTAEGASAPLDVVVVRDAPALFTANQQGTGPALAFDANFQPLTSVGSKAIILYAAGLGPTDPPSASSASGGAATEPLNRITDQLQALIGELPCTVAFAGLAPGWPGVYQLNVIPPANPQSNRVYLSMNGVLSNTATLPIPVGTNVTNVIGSIDGMYPASGSFAADAGNKATSGPVSISALLTAAEVTVNFDILPGAKPFTVRAVSPAGNEVFQIDPVSGTWRAEAITPWEAPRVGDFSRTGLQVYDLESRQPFPANVVPIHRLDPIALSATLRLPIPNSDPTPPLASPNGTVTFAGTLPKDGHFSIGPNYLPGPYFGGFLDIGLAPVSTQTAQFLLFVDGMLVASKDVPYDVY